MKNNTIRNKAIKSYYTMISRCKLNKNYKDVTISTEWLKDRQLFIDWFEANYKEGYSIDKDIKVPNSRLYSAETCLMVPPEVNNAFRGKKENSRGNKDNDVVLPMGVSKSYNNSKNGYQSHCKVRGVQTHLGCFSTASEAHRAWQVAKIEQIKGLLSDELPDNIITALESWIEIIQNDIKNGVETKI